MVKASGFRPAWWLPGPHLQTLYPALLGRRPAPPAERERVELPDGDFLDLDHLQGEGPTVLVLHGLEGSIESPYAVRLAAHLRARGYGVAVMHFRGCSGEPNRLPRGYHSGDTADLRHVLGLLRRRAPASDLAAVGYSLGGNVLLKYLGEEAEAAPLRAAVAVSVPFVLARAADRIDRGFSRLYQWSLLRRIKAGLRRKAGLLAGRIELDAALAARDFWRFDDLVTAPLHGFGGVQDYYARSSSRSFLPGIRVPTLILHARDDPFIDPAAIPAQDELPPGVTLELSERGGHVGFIAGRVPLRPRYWLEPRIADFLGERLGRP